MYVWFMKQHAQDSSFPGAGLAVAQDASAQQIRLGKPAGVVPPVQISAHLLGDQRLADKVKVSIMDILPISKDLSGAVSYTLQLMIFFIVSSCVIAFWALHPHVCWANHAFFSVFSAHNGSSPQCGINVYWL